MKNLNVFVFRCVVGRTLLDTYWSFTDQKNWKVERYKMFV